MPMSTMTPRSRTTTTWVFSGLLVLANVLIWLSPRNSPPNFLGAVLLFCVLPGQLAIQLIFPLPYPKPGVRLLLGMALSYAMSNVVVFVLTIIPTRMELVKLVATLDLISLIFLALHLFISLKPWDENRKYVHVSWPYIAVLLMLLIFFRLIGLGFAEFIMADELSIMSTVTDVLSSEAPTLPILLDRGKPIIETSTVTAFVLFNRGYSEFAVRLPFALASLASVLFLYLLGRVMFSESIGFIAASLFALEGTCLAVSRFAQYHGIVFLMTLSSLYCFAEANFVTEEKTRSRLLILGSLFFAFGCMTHYDAIMILPVLIILYFRLNLLPTRENILLLAVCISMIILIVAPFYLPLTFSAESERARSYVISKRVGLGTGLFNNIQTFIYTEMLFRNSIYYVIVMVSSLFGAIVFKLRRHLMMKSSMFPIWLLFGAGLLISTSYPNLVQLGQVNLAMVAFIPLFLASFLTSAVEFPHRMSWLWFITPITVYGFLTQNPGSHLYTMYPSWCLISATFILRVWSYIRNQLGLNTPRYVSWSIYTAFVAIASGYLYMFFIQQNPGYVVDFPQHKNEFYWGPHQTRPMPNERIFDGVPRQGGWKVIKYLYEIGTLRGHLRLAGARDTFEWYMGYGWDWDDTSRYILYSETPEYTYQQGHKRQGDLPLNVIQESSCLTGRVLVRSAPKILIYESRTTDCLPSSVRDFQFEEYAPLYDDTNSLDQRLRYKEMSVDNRTFFRVADLIEKTSYQTDGIIFTDRYQAGIFGYHYNGALPYFGPAASVWYPDDLGAQLSTKTIPGSKSYIILWATPGSKERQMWDAWFAQKDNLLEQAWYGNEGLIIYSNSSKQQLHLLTGTKVGGQIELLAYQVRTKPGRQAMTVTLYWAVSQHPTENYTVFTHLVDKNGRLLGQQDNQPVEGTYPTTDWRTDKVIPDTYEILLNQPLEDDYYIAEIGLYDAKTGQRLSTEGENSLTEGRISLPFSFHQEVNRN